MTRSLINPPLSLQAALVVLAAAKKPLEYTAFAKLSGRFNTMPHLTRRGLIRKTGYVDHRAVYELTDLGRRAAERAKIRAQNDVMRERKIAPQ